MSMITINKHCFKEIDRNLITAFIFIALATGIHIPNSRFLTQKEVYVSVSSKSRKYQAKPRNPQILGVKKKQGCPCLNFMRLCLAHSRQATLPLTIFPQAIPHPALLHLL
jgi:hypothetical protein